MNGTLKLYDNTLMRKLLKLNEMYSCSGIAFLKESEAVFLIQVLDPLLNIIYC